MCDSSCFLDYSPLSCRQSHAPVLPPNSEPSLHSASRWDSCFSAAVRAALPPPPWTRAEACWLWQTHTSVLTAFTCTQGSTTTTMGGGSRRAQGLGRKPQDGTADLQCVWCNCMWWQRYCWNNKKDKGYIILIDPFWPTGEPKRPLFWALCSAGAWTWIPAQALAPGLDSG